MPATMPSSRGASEYGTPWNCKEVGALDVYLRRTLSPRRPRDPHCILWTQCCVLADSAELAKWLRLMDWILENHLCRPISDETFRCPVLGDFNTPIKGKYACVCLQLVFPGSSLGPKVFLCTRLSKHHRTCIPTLVLTILKNSYFTSR